MPDLFKSVCAQQLIKTSAPNQHIGFDFWEDTLIWKNENNKKKEVGAVFRSREGLDVARLPWLRIVCVRVRSSSFYMSLMLRMEYRVQTSRREERSVRTFVSLSGRMLRDFSLFRAGFFRRLLFLVMLPFKSPLSTKPLFGYYSTKLLIIFVLWLSSTKL